MAGYMFKPSPVIKHPSVKIVFLALTTQGQLTVTVTTISCALISGYLFKH